MSDETWMEKGACVGHNPDMWFPENGTTKGSIEALRICAECPVRELCAQYAADERLDYGIWGGRTPIVRRPSGVRPRSSSNPGRRRRYPCPSHQAYRRHIRNGEEPCPGDLEAERVRTSVRDAGSDRSHAKRKADAA